MVQTDLATQHLFAGVSETDYRCLIVSNQRFHLQQFTLSLKPKFDLLVMLDYYKANKCFLLGRLPVLQE